MIQLHKYTCVKTHWTTHLRSTHSAVCNHSSKCEGRQLKTSTKWHKILYIFHLEFISDIESIKNQTQEYFHFWLWWSREKAPLSGHLSLSPHTYLLHPLPPNSQTPQYLYFYLCKLLRKMNHFASWETSQADLRTKQSKSH